MEKIQKNKYILKKKTWEDWNKNTIIKTNVSKIYYSWKTRTLIEKSSFLFYL